MHVVGLSHVFIWVVISRMLIYVKRAASMRDTRKTNEIFVGKVEGNLDVDGMTLKWILRYGLDRVKYQAVLSVVPSSIKGTEFSMLT